jgi:UDP-glucose 4-epimerase
MDFFRKRFPNIEVVHAPRRQGDVRKTMANVSLAKRELGFKAQVNIHDGLEQTWNWWGI